MWLYLVRHGESVYNAEGRLQGQSDVPLSKMGCLQAQAVAAALSDKSVEVIFASPLRRAYQTAEIIARQLRVSINVDDRLKEIHVGIFQDRLRTEIIELYPDEFARWKSGDPDFVIPGGESRNQLKQRGEAAVRDILATGYRQIAIIAHGRMLAVTLAAMAELPSIEPGTPSLENGSVTTVRARRDGRLEVTDFNATGHLASVGLSGRGDL